MFKLVSLFAALCLALSACVTTPEPASTGVQLNITGAADMNGGLPTQVKVYYLASDASFRSGDFFALFNEPEVTLGSDLVAVDDFQLVPGRSVGDSRSFAQAPGAIGVVAAFRDIDGSRFLASRALIPDSPNAVTITVGANTVSIR
ncbi:type VI secretion system lipoprotein TssJ [Salipiger bermudensis]|uniref:type VI secretion system lipoprotein TssJ n=1 Tax=Salipiger bermudensis TaxID=344736 RepID=UPI001A8E0CEF|nr:type VI secretion system lipoprotein TssJ [Salipiger bermudensis]MBN9676734.1 type VI secretion system lipoprotein TssJ [Salipiger bermudensis]